MRRLGVILVEDEVLILEELKVSIPWKEYGFEVLGTAGNGIDGERIIEELDPDIVITDIRMPVMDGLALAGKCSEEFPDVIFIVLTSLAEFGLAKEAIRYGISDYLLKTELDGNALLNALKKAEEERSRRRGDSSENNENSINDKVISVISNLLLMRDMTQGTKTLLSERGYLDGFAFIAFAFSFPSPSLEKQWTSTDYKRLHDWEKDIIEKILPSFFSSYFPVIPVAGKEGTLIYFVSGLSSDTWPALSSRVESKIAAASLMVTGMEPVLIKTDVMNGRDSLKSARSMMERSLMAFYLGRNEPVAVSSLEIDSVFPRLESAIKEKEIVSCRTCFSLIKNSVESFDHSLSQFEFMVAVLRSALSSGLSSIGLKNDTTIADIFEGVDFITRRSEAVSFIADVATDGAAVDIALTGFKPSASFTDNEALGISNSPPVDKVSRYYTMAKICSFGFLGGTYQSLQNYDLDDEEQKERYQAKKNQIAEEIIQLANYYRKKFTIVKR